MNSYKELKLSLTKFGYHKVSMLLKRYEPKQIFDHLDDEGDKIDSVQVSKILSKYYHEEQSIWDFWSEVKLLGQQDLNDIIFFAIIFSHTRLSNLIKDSFQNNNGVIYRDNEEITEKEYTNFARTSFELGFVIEEKLERGNDRFTLDVSRINYKFYLPSFVLRLVQIKLLDAEAPKEINVLTEIYKEELHFIFNMSQAEFKEWIEGNLNTKTFRDVKRFPREYLEGIKFKSGHNPKFEGNISGIKTPKKYISTLTHNRLQTKIFQLLKQEYPDSEIGTEVPCDSGSIDIARKTNDSFVLYELKTSTNIQACVREAFGQLMEYAYSNDKTNIDHLIIITPNKATNETEKYFHLLRNQFLIPIYYQYFDESQMKLSQLY